MDEQNRAKPKRRRFQYRLKSLFVLPIVVGLLLVLYLYWDDWRKQRPPFQNNVADYQAAHKEFFNDLAAGRLDHAYESTSARFTQRMSRSEFDRKIANFSAAWHGPESEEASLESSFDPSQNVCTRTGTSMVLPPKGQRRTSLN